MTPPLLTAPAVVDSSTFVAGPVATGWLQPTGRVPAVLAAWQAGALGEAPTGIAWDVLRIPRTVGYETVAQLRAAGVPLGPVLHGPLGTEFFIALGSADGWDAPDSHLLPAHKLMLLPHPDYNERNQLQLGARCWIIPPTGTTPLTAGPALRTAYPAARARVPEAQR